MIRCATITLLGDVRWGYVADLMQTVPEANDVTQLAKYAAERHLDLGEYHRVRAELDMIARARQATRASDSAMGCEAVSMTISDVDGAVVVDVDDAFSAPTLFEVLYTISVNSHVSIEMENVRFMDSRGLRVLAVHAMRLRASGGSLKISHPSSAVRRMVEIAGLGEFIKDRPRAKSTEADSSPRDRESIVRAAQADMGRLPARLGARTRQSPLPKVAERPRVR